MATPTGAGARIHRLHSSGTLRPSTTAELHEAVLDTTHTRPRLVVRGAGSADRWAEPEGPADAVVDTTDLTGVLTYNPADMTVAVRAGTPLAALQCELGEHGQRVAFDPARAGRDATVGGLLATADGGPSRHAYGTLRDLVIGVTVVLADGTVARSGGHVIKNVAGYDLGKLFYGSFGTLGALSEVVLRLHPVPRCAITATVETTRAEAFATARGIVEAGLEPSAVELVGLGDDAEPRLLVRFEGTPVGVAERAGALPSLARGPVRALDETDAECVWAEVAGICTGEPGDTVVRFGALPSAAATTAARVAVTAADLGVGLASTATISGGVHTLRLRGGDAHARERLVREVQATVGPACTVLRRDGLGPNAPLWGRAPAAVALMGAVKRQFDPGDRFGTSRLRSWLAASPTDEELTV